MTTKAKTADTPAVEQVETKQAAQVAPVKRDVAGRATNCVVDDGTAHMGRAVNGRVCSAHAMHYRADGTRREK